MQRDPAEPDVAAAAARRSPVDRILSARAGWAMVAMFTAGGVATALRPPQPMLSAVAILAALGVGLVCLARAAASEGGLRQAWLLIAAGMLANAAGDAIWELYRIATGSSPSGISFADPPYLLTYPLLLAGVLRLLWLRAPRAATEILMDSTSVAMVAGLASWQFFVVNPGIWSEGSLAERVVSATYPLADTFLVAALVALFVIAPRRGGASITLLASFAMAFLAADVFFTFVRDGGGLPMAISDGSYLIAYGLLAAAAAHPSAALHDGAAWGSSRLRIGLLGASVVGAPTLAILTPTFGLSFHAPVYVGVSLVVSLLVLTRLMRVIRNLDGERRRLRQADRELAVQAMHDSLTGLPNRASLFHCLEREMAAASERGHRLALVFVDLDDFKFVNDSLGHRAGDELLRDAGQRIRRVARAGDLVARIGGDEFVIIAPHVTGVEEARGLADRIIEALQAPFRLFGQVAYVAGSAGIALLEDHEDPSALLRDADVALYQAKAAGGRETRVFDTAMRQWSEERRAVETTLRVALARGELAVAYQPMVELATGRIVAVEALLRLPSRPEIPVVRLIEMAELAGFIHEIGRWVLRRACADIRELNTLHDGRPISVSVNVSARQLRHSTLVEDVGRAISEHDIDPAWLGLELTEAFLADDPEHALTALTALRRIGVRVEIDDFGAGYSSFARLGKFPLDGLKIDRSFVAQLDTHAETESIVEAVITLSRALDLRVTAEGVEAPRHADVLRRLSCDLAQGYLFGRPMPLHELAALIAADAPLDTSAAASGQRS